MKRIVRWGLPLAAAALLAACGGARQEAADRLQEARGALSEVIKTDADKLAPKPYEDAERALELAESAYHSGKYGESRAASVMAADFARAATAQAEKARAGKAKPGRKASVAGAKPSKRAPL